MPMRALKPCRYPRCPELCAERYCKAHANCEFQHVKSRKQTNTQKMAADSFYRSRAWRWMRAEQLRREPLCRACSSELNPVVATEVDHIRQISQGGAKRDFGNLQSLCKRCHDRKRQKESIDARKG